MDADLGLRDLIGSTTYRREEIFACIEKFKRLDKGMQKVVPIVGERNNQVAYEATRPSNNLWNKGKKIAQVVSGKSPVITSQIPEQVEVNLRSSDNQEYMKTLRHKMVGELKNYHALNSISNAFVGAGYNDDVIDYLGDLWILINLKNNDEKEDLIANHELRYWFNTLKQWEPKFEIKSRITWLVIEGVPIQVRCANSFISIARQWDEVLVTDPC
ncbi:hypothetical protein LXL04_034590 [Taraxacum kok-saghyz]